MMQVRNATMIVLLAITLLMGIVAQGQTAQENAERIRQLRAEITKRETADVPSDLVDLNRSKLIERRAELRTLLKVEIQNLQKHRTLLGEAITPEESQKIDEVVRNLGAEIDRLGASIQAELAAERPGTNNVMVSVQPLPPSNPSASGNNNSQPPPNTASTNNAIATVPVTVPAPSAPPPALAGPLSVAPPQGNADESKETINCPDVDQGTKAASELDKIVCGLVRDIPLRRAARNFATNRIDLGSDQRFELVKILIAKKATPSYLVEAEDVRMDKQMGTTPGDNNSTSLVAKGGVPAILGFAVENGGLTRSVDGSAITFRGNPVGLFNAVANRGFVPSVKEDENDPLLRFLKRTSFAFTFNTDRGPDLGVFTGTKQQLSSFSGRVELINNRRASQYIKDWEDFLSTKAQRLADVINESEFIDDSDPQNRKWLDPALQAWFEQTQAALATATDPEISGILQARLDNLPVDQLQPQTKMFLDAIEQNLGLYMSGRDELLAKINSGTLVTFEYLNKREVNAPDTSNFTFIAEKGTQGGKVDFTFNGSLTMFNNLDALRSFVSMNPTLPRARRLRDFQFAGQIDVPFGSVWEFGQFVFFAGGRYERLLENATTDLGQILPNTKGDIGYLQLGLKVPIKGTGFKIPFSVTFANRTELIKEKTIKGNFGFSLDLDTLFARFKPF